MMMKRHSIGVDISKKYVKLIKRRLNKGEFQENPYEPRVYQGNAMDLKPIADDSIDLILSSPPYFNIKRYATDKDEENAQIGSVNTLEEYLIMMSTVLKESFRVLKPGKHCCIIVSDVRKKWLIPLPSYLIGLAERNGFKLHDDIIHHTTHSKTKARHRGNNWGSSVRLRMCTRTHEHILVFRKPVS